MRTQDDKILVSIADGKRKVRLFVMALRNVITNTSSNRIYHSGILIDHSVDHSAKCAGNVDGDCAVNYVRCAINASGKRAQFRDQQISLLESETTHSLQ